MVEISANVMNAGAPGYSVLDPDVTVLVDAGVVVGSDQVGFFAGYGNTTLDNHGFLFGINLSGTGYGVQYASDPNGTLHNESDGSIFGWTTGVVIQTEGVTVGNEGTITGLKGTGYYNEVTDNQLLNSGLITGPQIGIFENLLGGAIGGTTVIGNEGTVRSDGIAIVLSAALVFNSAVTSITNHAGGVIAGANAAIQTTAGTAAVLHLTNELGGLITGNINCLAANEVDTITNQGTIAGVIHLGSGDDTFTGVGAGSSGAVFGEAGIDHLTGSNANDLLDGGLGNDTINGGGGQDVITGGLGKDTLNGQAGGDRFVFNAAAESRPGPQADTIVGFTHAQGDKIDLRGIDATTGGGDNVFLFAGAASFGDFNAAHFGGAVRVVAGAVQIDIDGNNTVDMVILTPGVTLVAGDFFL